MKASKNTLIAVLGVVLLAGAALAWRQYRELIVLRAQVADGDLAALKRELADARKSIKSLEDRIAALRGRRGGGSGEGEGTFGDADSPQGNSGPRGGGRFRIFAELSGNPEFQKLLAIQMKGRIDQTYAPLFKALNLSPEQLSQFQSLLAEKQQSLLDVMQAAQAQGMSPRSDPDGMKTLMSQAISQVDANIQQALGDAGYQQYQQYQQTLPERNVVNTLQQSLSYTQTPLTDDEANQMISLLAQNQPQRAGNGTAGTANGGDPGPGPISLMNGGGNAKVTNDAITQAQGVLSGPQVSALQQIQQQQQAQQQIQQLMRNANQNAGGTGTGAAPTTAAPAPSGGN